MNANKAEDNFVGRVYQNDAETLDREAVAAIRNQIHEGAKYLMPNFYSSVEPEVIALVKLLMWHYTVRQTGSTFGQRLLGLSYTGFSSAQTTLYVLLTVAPDWLRQRLPDLLRHSAAPRQRREKLLRAADAAELLVRLASLLNLVLFLRGGVFATLPERLLGLRKRRAAQDLVSETNYTFLTREFLWRGFSELLMCALPLMSLGQLRTSLLRLLPSWAAAAAPSPAASLAARAPCVYCGQPPILPHTLQCCHLSCYYCLQAALGSAQVALCAQCGRETRREEAWPAPAVRGLEAS